MARVTKAAERRIAVRRINVYGQIYADRSTHARIYSGAAVIEHCAHVADFLAHERARVATYLNEACDEAKALGLIAD